MEESHGASARIARLCIMQSHRKLCFHLVLRRPFCNAEFLLAGMNVEDNAFNAVLTVKVM